MCRFRNISVFVLLIILLTSCEVSKQAFKLRNDINKETLETVSNNIETVENTTSEKIREGGYISTDIIPENERERDENGDIKELIQEMIDGGLTKTIYYRPDGSTKVDCKASDILERLETSIVTRDKTFSDRLDKLDQKINAKEVDKKASIGSEVILYIFIGFALLIFVVGFVAIKFLNKKIEAIKLL